MTRNPRSSAVFTSKNFSNARPLGLQYCDCVTAFLCLFDTFSSFVFSFSGAVPLQVLVALSHHRSG